MKSSTIDHRVDAAPERIDILNSWVETFSVSTFVDCIEKCVNVGKLSLIGNHNVNSLTLLRTSDENFRTFYRLMDHCFVDGMGVVLLAKVEGRAVRAAHRTAVLDWIWPLLARAEEKGWHVVHLGSSEETADAASAHMKARHPDLNFTNISGYFDATVGSAENKAVLDRLAELRPDVLMVGMGMPRQESWIVDNLEDLPDCPVITVGGILGFIGEERSTAPRLVGRLGLEWVFRLATEPRRLWRRYLIEPFELLGPVLTAVRGRIRHPRDRA